MVTTGTSGRYNNKSEVIDLMDPTKTCQPWVEYPIGVDSAVGVFIQDKLVICGGDSTFTAGNGAVDRCFALGPSEVTEMTMSAASYSSAAGTFHSDPECLKNGKRPLFRDLFSKPNCDQICLKWPKFYFWTR